MSANFEVICIATVYLYIYKGTPFGKKNKGMETKSASFSNKEN